MTLDFTATESGFNDGMGGASGAASVDEQHYVLFGIDGNDVYFEYDDQIHGGVCQIFQISVFPDRIVFELHESNTITVRRQKDDGGWDEFVAGLRLTFPPTIVVGGL